MRARLYISLQGGAFDPTAFHAHAKNLVGGQVRRRKHSGEPFTNVPLDYWTSSEIDSEPAAVASQLMGLLTGIFPIVFGYSGKADIRVIAHVVLYYEPNEDPTGFHFPSELIRKLGEIGAALDIDAVRKIPE